ncbi:MAG: M23 family metallopeptidase [Bacteroidales bacterium]|nr:M23 family metallopeptidase [Bacteroidales bacterium]
MRLYHFNKEKHYFQPETVSAGQIVWTVIKYCLLGIAAAAVMYLIFALIVSTDREKKLALENEYLEQEYDRMSEQVDLLDDVIKNLELRDKTIYNDIFGMDPPSTETFIETDTIASDAFLASLTDDELAAYSKDEVDRIDERISNVNRQLRAIYQTLGDEEFQPTSLPSILPVENFKLAQTGASLGMKINPFYKTLRRHGGFDIIAAVGTEVMSTADGVVAKIDKASKGMGNSVTIDHRNGIQTVYGHLSEIYVHQGQNLKQGEVIARVGMSGTTFSGGLHYEVIRQGRSVEPVNYFFADLSPAVYRDMVVISSYTGQSID